jgi:ubiquitin-like modifier-activating enzyme 5
MEEEQLRALLHDLDALKQRPDDPTSIDRVNPPPTAPLHGSRQLASVSSLLPCLSNS